MADSYTFDIKLVDAEGRELQPADDQKVNVTFNMARAADPNLSADIYHITENEVIDEKTKETEIVLEAEKLETETDAKEETVTAETDIRNSAADSGGGIFMDEADLDLEKCTLKNNYAGQYGGGLAIDGDTTDIKGTTVIEDNISYGSGGGIYVRGGATLNMRGDVRITGNSSSNGGGGLGISDSKDNDINLKGKIFISNNDGYGPNVYFRSKTHPYSGARELSKLTLKEKLAEGSFIGLSVDYDIEGTSNALTSGYKKHYGKADPTLYFGGDNETTVQTNSDGEIVLHVSAWPTLQKLINEAANNDEPLILNKNWKSSKYDLPLTIPAGKTLNLDLNGHTLDRKLSSEDPRDDGEIFNVENGRTLIIDDSTMKKTGKLIGGNGKNGGAISVKEGGALELRGGNLTANKAEKGGAVYNEGTVIISGEDAINAALYGNTAKQGGGIYNAGTLTVNCDAIRGNTANVGGGVYNAAGTLNLSGAISGNETDESAGGVYLADGSAFNVSGAASFKGDNPFEDQTKTEVIPPTGKPEAGKHNITIDDGSGKGAKTGDSNDALVWIAIMLASMLALSGYAISRRKKNSR